MKQASTPDPTRAVISSPGENFHTVFAALGTTVEVRSQGPNDAALSQQLRQRVEDYEAAWSKFRSESEVSQLNRAAGSAHWIRVSPATKTLLLRFVELSIQTGAVVRPTIGPLTSLWQVKPWLAQLAAGHSPTLPNDVQVQQALAASALDRLAFDGHSSFQLRAGGSIDLGAVAKGWIADDLRDFMRSAGRANALVSIGSSSVAAAGTSPARRPWKVGVAAVTRPGESAGKALSRPIAGTATLADNSLATSGDNLQQLPQLWHGQRVHHLVDPRTGYPSQSGARQASVIARDGVLAEVLASTLLITGDPQALHAQLPKEDFQWLVVTDEAVTTSPNWPT